MRNNDRMLNESSRRQPAVKVQNACKAYSKGSPVLNNFDMTVQRGTIYGLLGASGCGKTTILSCIVGIRKLDSGEINVFGARPGTKGSGIPGKTIGYMPQEIALYVKFTIKEIIQYFGRIYNMTSGEILSRMEFLVNFLDLPDSSRVIDTLSGGQQRRTSLAVAMMHEPELLILDEPTVGVDPLIRESIWEYLGEMVKRRQTTVIITTHYIEEARQSNMVGMMRNGKLLVEQSPITLLAEHNTNLLEDIVLKLCKKDNLTLSTTNGYADEIAQVITESSFYTTKKSLNDAFENSESVVGLKFKSRSPDYDTLFRRRTDHRRYSLVKQVNEDAWSHLNKFLAIVIRNFIVLLRNPLFLLLIIMIPTIQVTIFNLILNGTPTDIKMGLVNGELDKDSLWDSCSRRADGCFNSNMSCSFINEFSGDYKWTAFSSEEEALESVQLGNSWGFVTIPANFTEHMKDRSLWKNFITNETIEGTTIKARYDMSDSLQRNVLIGFLHSNYQSFVKKMVTDCGGDSRVAEIPLKFNSVYGSLNGGYAHFLQPPQILLTIFLIPMTAGVVYVMDKKAGTLERTLVAGVDFFHIMLGMIISEGTLILLELTVCFSVAILIFGFTAKGSWILIFLICLLTGLTGLSYGFLVGALCSHELELMILILGTYLPIMILSGGTWPLQGLPPWILAICNSLPITLPIESFRSIAARGWGITHPHVWPGFVSVTIWIALLCLLNVMLHRFNK